MEKSIFQFSDYKAYVCHWVESRPSRGRGLYARIAERIGAPPVVVSQVFKGPRELTLEQSIELVDFLELSPLERQYFLLMVQRERAGNHKLKKFFLEQLSEIKLKAQSLKTRVPQDKEMSPAAKSVFYSSWYYSGVRILTSIEEFDSVQKIADRLNLPRVLVQDIVEFLLQHGLCIEERGRLKIGPQRTHLEGQSPLVAQHHSNWRLRGLDRMRQRDASELYYTGPMSLSVKDFEALREELAQVISKFTKRVSDSSAEIPACLNIDFFKY